MADVEFTAKLREFQVSLDMYIRRFESFEKELNAISHQQAIYENKVCNGSDAVKELRSIVDSLVVDIKHHHEEFFHLYLDFSNHLVKSNEAFTDITSVRDDLKNIHAQSALCEKQIAELMNKNQALQASLSNLNTSLSKLDTTVTKNDLLIGKLDFTLKAIIGLISGLVAAIGSAVAGWDYLVKVFSK